MRLMCDEMLHGLGRWLRAAGYDTAIAVGGVADRDLVRRCAAERRILLTRDRHLAAAAQGQTPLVIVGGGSLADAARGVAKALTIDWLHAPFTRCLLDNTPLDPAPPEMAAEVPQRSRAAGGPLRLCPLCRRLYWPVAMSAACRRGSPNGPLRRTGRRRAASRGGRTCGRGSSRSRRAWHSARAR